MTARIGQALEQALAASGRVTLSIDDPGPASAGWSVNRVEREVITIPLDEWTRLVAAIHESEGPSA